jgi:hypothetical protein
MKLFILLGLFLATSGVSSADAATAWQTLGFDGTGFQKGAAGGAILVRDGYLPVPAGAGAPHEDQLPGGTGAVAVFCFVQSSGGKLRLQAGFLPMGAAVVSVTGKSLTVAGRTDASGYLILALPPGSYDVRLFGFLHKVTVETGKTALVAIRGGKRMGD